MRIVVVARVVGVGGIMGLWSLFAERLKVFYWFTGGLRCAEETKLISISVAAKGEVVR